MSPFQRRWLLFPLGFAVLAAACLIVPPSRAETLSPVRDFDAYVAKAVADWQVPGLAVAVLHHDQVVFAKGYGVRSLGGDEHVDTETLFAIGSTTKAMTAVAIGMLVDEGKLGWDDPVIQHLPDYQLEDPYVTREITLRDLLAHRTGVGNSDFLWYQQEKTTGEILKAMRHIDQAASLRSTFIYQNVMYTAAGEVVAAVSGMSWADFVRQRIFVPLGMHGALPTATDLAEQSNVAAPHDRIDGEITVIDNASADLVAPAGSVWAGVGDMAKWLRFLLAGGVGESGERLLSEAVHRELFVPQMIIRQEAFYPTARLTRPHWTTYGLAWFQADYQGRAVDFHTGSIDGMVAIAGMIRDEGLGVFVLANLDHAEVRHALMYRAFDLFGQKRQAANELRDWSAEFLQLYTSLREQGELAQEQQEEARVVDAPPSLPVQRYVGLYEHAAYGKVEVMAAGDGLRMRFGKLTGPLEPWHYETFKMKFDTAWRGSLMVTFKLDAQGNPALLDLGVAEFRRTVTP